MDSHLQIIEEVTLEEVTRGFTNHEDERDELDINPDTDETARRVIRDLGSASSLSFWKCNTTLEASRNLILPWHRHPNRNKSETIALLDEEGAAFEELSDYFEKLKDNPKKEDCIDKIQRIKRSMFSDGSCQIFDSKFMLLSNDKELVHPNNYHGTYQDKLFIANGFHRLFAYSLTLRELDKFVPIEVYYVENTQLP